MDVFIIRFFPLIVIIPAGGLNLQQITEIRLYGILKAYWRKSLNIIIDLKITIVIPVVINMFRLLDF